MKTALNPFTGKLQLLGSSSFGGLTGAPGDNTALAAALAAKLDKAGGTMTGALAFSGTTHVGLKPVQLTTAQRDALTPVAGDGPIWNSTTGRHEFRNATQWTSFVRLGGDTMTGALAVTPGTLATTGLRLAQTWNSAGTTCRALEVAVTDTACATNSTLVRFLGGALGSTQLFAVDKSGNPTFRDPSFHSVDLRTLGSGVGWASAYGGTLRSGFGFNTGTGYSPLMHSVAGGECLFGVGGTDLGNPLGVSPSFLGFIIGNTAGTATFAATDKDYNGGYTGAGHATVFRGGRGSSQGTGGAGGSASLLGGDARGSGNNNGGNVTITGGAPTGSGTRGNVLITNLPTSSAGLPTGALWNNAGVLNIA